MPLPHAIPRRSPLLPALRDPVHVVDRLQFRQQLLTDSGDLTEAARMARRANRVVRWQEEEEAQAPKAASKATPKKEAAKPRVVASPAKPAHVDALDELIAGVNVQHLLGGK